MRSSSARGNTPLTVESLIPEIRTLLVCARTIVGSSDVEELQVALSDCASPDRLCQVAVEHRMLGHLHKVATSSPDLKVDPRVAGRLADMQRAAVHISLRQTSQLLRILDALKAAEVEAIPFKGPVWAQQLYGDSTLRNSTDLDLLVDSAQAPLARQALIDQGFVDFDPFNEKMLLGRQRAGGQIILHEPASTLLVDLHWMINVALGHRALDFLAVDARVARIELLERPVKAPGPLDMFIITCLEGTRDRWDTVGRLLDCAVQIQGMPSEEWPTLLDLAGSYGSLRRVLVAVAHVCAMLKLEVPEPVASGVADDRLARALGRSLHSSALVERPPDGLWERIILLFWNSATEDRSRDRVSQAVSRLFMPTSEDWRVISLPRPFEWLYYPLRPARLTAKWLRRSFRPLRRGASGPSAG